MNRIKIISTFVCLAIATLSFSQKQGPLDSLKDILAKDINDSTRLITQLRLAERYYMVDMNQARYYSFLAKELAKKIDMPWALYKNHSNLGFYYMLTGDYSTALHHDVYALHNSLRTGDSAAIAFAHNAIGKTYYDLGRYDEAYDHFTLSYSIAKSHNDSLGMTISLHNVGSVFKELNQDQQARQHLKLSRKISYQINDKVGEAFYFYELGCLQAKSQAYDSALSSFFTAQKYITKYNLGEIELKNLLQIANVYLEKGNYDLAQSYYDSTETVYRNINNTFGLAEVSLNKGILFMRQNNFEKAKSHIMQSLKAAQSLHARTLEIRCYYNLYLIAEKNNNFETALANFKKFDALKDSIYSQEMTQKLYRDQIRFESESKDNQIARQKDALKREEFIRNILVVVFALSVILLVTVYRSGQRRKEINSLLITHQEETEKRSEELERLNQVKDKFFSIISHDLRSPINALSGILDIMTKGGLSQHEFEEQTRELRIRFNHTRTLLNNLLDWTLLQMDKLSLQHSKVNLKALVDENIQILSSLQTKSINLINNVTRKAVADADSNTINLVIRNLLTNAIKFTNDGGSVIIDSEERPHEWLISVKDNGIGIEPEVQQILFDKTSPYTTRGTANERGTGLGLILCKEFVEKNGGRIWVESQPGRGSIFKFTVPKQEQIEE